MTERFLLQRSLPSFVFFWGWAIYFQVGVLATHGRTCNASDPLVFSPEDKPFQGLSPNNRNVEKHGDVLLLCQLINLREIVASPGSSSGSLLKAASMFCTPALLVCHGHSTLTIWCLGFTTDQTTQIYNIYCLYFGFPHGETPPMVKPWSSFLPGMMEGTGMFPGDSALSCHLPSIWPRHVGLHISN